MLGYKESEAVRKLTFDSLIEPEDARAFRKALEIREYGGKDRLFSLRNVAEKQRGKKDTGPRFPPTCWSRTASRTVWYAFSGTCGKYIVLEREKADQARIPSPGQDDVPRPSGRQRRTRDQQPSFRHSQLHPPDDSHCGPGSSRRRAAGEIRAIPGAGGKGGPTVAPRSWANLLTFSRMKPVSFEPVDLAGPDPALRHAGKAQAGAEQHRVERGHRRRPSHGARRFQPAATVRSQPDIQRHRRPWEREAGFPSRPGPGSGVERRPCM